MKAEIMRYTFEEEFRLDHPEGVGETGSYFYLDNYKDWLEVQLIEARKQLTLYNVVGQSEQLPQIHGLTRCECGEVYDVDLKVNCPKCGN